MMKKSRNKSSITLYLVKLPCVEATGAASDAKCHSAVFDLFVPTAPMLSVIGHSY
jgi:hypothetical protein